MYPINGDGGRVAETYVAALRQDAFRPIEVFFQNEARRHGRDFLRPVEISLASPLADLPPRAPGRPRGLDVVMWSLKMRYWAWRHDAIPGARPHVRLFVLYFDPDSNPMLSHSVGLERGLIGVVNAFASRDMAGSNNVVAIHELLHTLGATDKYAPGDNLPRHPDGYAEPDRQPLHPQRYAEIMGGRIPVSEDRAEIPVGPEWVLIGPATADEIGLRRR